MNINLICTNGKIISNFEVEKIYPWQKKLKNNRTISYYIVYNKEGNFLGLTWENGTTNTVKHLINIVESGEYKKLPQNLLEYRRYIEMGESINKKVIQNKSANSKKYAIYLPVEWAKRMGLDKQGSSVNMLFIGNTVVMSVPTDCKQQLQQAQIILDENMPIGNHLDLNREAIELDFDMEYDNENLFDTSDIYFLDQKNDIQEELSWNDFTDKMKKNNK